MEREGNARCGCFTLSGAHRQISFGSRERERETETERDRDEKKGERGRVKEKTRTRNGGRVHTFTASFPRLIARQRGGGSSGPTLPSPRPIRRCESARRRDCGRLRIGECVSRPLSCAPFSRIHAELSPPRDATSVLFAGSLASTYFCFARFACVTISYRAAHLHLHTRAVGTVSSALPCCVRLVGVRARVCVGVYRVMSIVTCFVVCCCYFLSRPHEMRRRCLD